MHISFIIIYTKIPSSEISEKARKLFESSPSQRAHLLQNFRTCPMQLSNLGRELASRENKNKFRLSLTNVSGPFVSFTSVSALYPILNTPRARTKRV